MSKSEKQDSEQQRDRPYTPIHFWHKNSSNTDETQESARHSSHPYKRVKEQAEYCWIVTIGFLERFGIAIKRIHNKVLRLFVFGRITYKSPYDIAIIDTTEFSQYWDGRGWIEGQSHNTMK